jgi:hypothetical protein
MTTLGLAVVLAASSMGAITVSSALAQSAPHGAQSHQQQHGCGTSFGPSCADSN